MEDYDAITSSSIFMRRYDEVLEKLTPLERRIMRLSFDSNGIRQLTNREISKCLGIELDEVDNAKERIYRRLRKDKALRKQIAKD